MVLNGGGGCCSVWYWCSLASLLCYFFCTGALSFRIASHTGLVLGNNTYLELNGKEVEYINTYVISKITEVAPYLLVEDGTIQLSNLVEAYYCLYKYSQDGTRMLTYQARTTDERGNPIVVPKEAVFGVLFQLKFQVPPPPTILNTKPTSESEDKEAKEKATNEEKGETTTENKEEVTKDKGDNEETKTEESKNKEKIEEVKESMTTELTIFQDIKGMFSIRSCVSFKTPSKQEETTRESAVAESRQAPSKEEIETESPETKEPEELKIMSYNIWNYNSPWEVRHNMIADEVLAALPDIIAWQEVRYSRWDKMNSIKQVNVERWGGTRYQLEQLGTALLERGLKYHFVFQPSMVYVHNLPEYEIEGLAYYSKHPILESNFASLSRAVDNHKDEHQRLCFRALIDTPQGKLNLFVTHMSLDEEAQIRNAQEILKFADQYDYPQVLMGDFNCLPNATAIKFLTGVHAIDGTTGNFVDAWVDFTSRISPMCDTNGICTRPCTRTTVNATCWEEDGHTFNALDDIPRKRIDFMLVRGAVRIGDVNFVGNTPKTHEGKKVMASDHFGMLSKFLFNKEKP